MSKFYRAINCNRTITSEGLAFAFSPYEHSGTWMGVLATDKDSEIKALTKLVENKKSGVTEISEAEYQSSLKKKLTASTSYSPSLAASPMPGSQDAPSVGQPINSEPAEPVERVAPLESVDEAIKPVVVERKARK